MADSVIHGYTEGSPPRVREQPLMPLHQQFRNLIALLALTVTPLLASAIAPTRAAEAEILYSLDTLCSLGGAAAVTCKVEAVENGNATLYRHTIGERTITIHISDEPTRMTWIEGATGASEALNSAGVQFSSNTICFNDRELCVVNANYLNSIQEESPDPLEGRDLVRVLFGSDGRVALTCYDEACGKVNW